MSEKIKLLRQECEHLRIELEHKTNTIEIFKAELKKVNESLTQLTKKLNKDQLSLTQLFQSIVPTKIPRIPGFNFSTHYKAGSKFNGDYFDVFEHSDRLRFGTILCKSPNPSVSATILALLLKLNNELEHRWEASPSETLSNIISQIPEECETPDLFLGYFNKRDFSFHFSSSPKIHGFIKNHKDQSVIPLLSSTNPKSPLRNEKVKLSGQDTIILMTHGYFSIQNKKGEFISEAEVIQILHSLEPKATAHDTRHKLLFKLDQHNEGQTPTHDITLVVFSPEEPVLRLA